jgi:hypothetical protein
MSFLKKKRQATTESQRTVLCKKKQETPGMTHSVLKKWFEQEYGFSINQSTISRISMRSIEYLENVNVWYFKNV